MLSTKRPPCLIDAEDQFVGVQEDSERDYMVETRGKDKTVMWLEVQPYGTPRQPDPRLKEKGHKGSKSGKGSKAINQPIVSCVTRGGDSCSEGEADGSLSVWAGAPAVGGHGRSAEGQAGSSAASRERPAVARRAGEAARASARQVAPRLADSLRLDAIIVPLSPAEKWLEDFVMLFHRDALRTELKRRGHSPTGLKRQLACRLVRDGSANDVSTESIWRLAALEAVNRTGRESSGGHRASILAALETEQSLVSYLRSRE